MADEPEQINPNLSDEQRRVLFGKGTEAPFTGKFYRNSDKGTYTCANCGAVLFDSGTKYESHVPGLAGWPSFADIAKSGAVKLVDDNSHGMSRIEAVCANCGVHLGHLFEDDESTTGKHYCINSACLDFEPADKHSDPNTK